MLANHYLVATAAGTQEEQRCRAEIRRYTTDRLCGRYVQTSNQGGIRDATWAVSLSPVHVQPPAQHQYCLTALRSGTHTYNIRIISFNSSALSM